MELNDFLLSIIGESEIRPIQEKWKLFLAMDLDTEDIGGGEGGRSSVNRFPEDSPKKFISWTENKHQTWKPTTIEKKSFLIERSKTMNLLIGSPDRKQSWKAFQENLTPIIITKPVRMDRAVFCLASTPSTNDKIEECGKGGLLIKGRHSY